MPVFLSIFRNHRTYLAGFGFFALIALVWIMLFDKSDSFIQLNGVHNFALDVFFVNYTFLGDGIFASALVLFCWWKGKRQLALQLLTAFLISGLAAQIIKNLIDAPRPRLFFEASQYRYFIDGITLANNHSFPSGHTATAFALATIFALHFNKKHWSVILLAGAVLVAYSRLYLAQHFLIDVWVGAWLGLLGGLLAFVLLSIRIPAKFKKKAAWYEDMANPAIQ